MTSWALPRVVGAPSFCTTRSVFLRMLYVTLPGTWAAAALSLCRLSLTVQWTEALFPESPSRGGLAWLGPGARSNRLCGLAALTSRRKWVRQGKASLTAGAREAQITCPQAELFHITCSRRAPASGTVTSVKMLRCCLCSRVVLCVPVSFKSGFFQASCGRLLYIQTRKISVIHCDLLKFQGSLVYFF